MRILILVDLGLRFLVFEILGVFLSDSQLLRFLARFRSFAWWRLREQDMELLWRWSLRILYRRRERSCLHLSYVLYSMIQGAHLMIGVRRIESGISAHAWVSLDKRPWSTVPTEEYPLIGFWDGSGFRHDANSFN